MKAVIMAGGEGTRLRPLTSIVPKPMTRILDKPIIEYSVELLQKYGITDISFTLMYLPEVITEYYAEREDITPHFYLEKEPLGTAGSVKNAQEVLTETFFVISGDALTDVNIEAAANFHKSKGAQVTIILKRMENPTEYGIVVTDKDGKVSRFLEKPDRSEVFSDLVNTGMYIIEPEVLDFIPKGKQFDFSKELFPELIAAGIPIYGYVTGAYWCDIGNIDSFLAAQEDVLRGAVDVTIDAINHEGIYTADGAVISAAALLQPPAYIGKNTVVRAGARVGMYSVIGENSVIGEGAVVKRSLLGHNVFLGKNAKVSRGILCDNTVLEENARMFENSVIGADCTIGEGATVSPRVKVWPGKWIESGITVNKNVIWGFGQKRGILTPHGVTGRLNTDISADELTRLGMAMASAGFGKLVVSSDGSATADAAKSAFSAGAASSGAAVTAAISAIPPVLSAVAHELDMDGGAYFKRAPEGRFSVLVFGKKGRPLEKAREKKINNVFDRGEFRRAEADEIRPVFELTDASRFHSKMLAHSKVSEAVRRANPEICVIKTATAADAFLTDAFSQLNIRMASGEEGALFTAKPYPDGDDGEVRFESLTLKGEDLDILRYAVAFSTFELTEITIPVGSSDLIKEMAERHGVSVREANTAKPFARSETMFSLLFTDFAFFMAALAKNLLESGIAPQKYFKEVPRPHIVKAQVTCDFKDMGRLLRELTDKFEIECPECGIKIESDKGWSFICPNDTEPHIDIKAEGTTEEFARELCDFYTEEIKTTLNRARQ